MYVRSENDRLRTFVWKRKYYVQPEQYIFANVWMKNPHLYVWRVLLEVS